MRVSFRMKPFFYLYVVKMLFQNSRLSGQRLPLFLSLSLSLSLSHPSSLSLCLLNNCHVPVTHSLSSLPQLTTQFISKITPSETDI